MADWTLPATAQGWWTHGTNADTPGVGVPGGIEQYLSGGVNDRAVVGGLIDVTASPHNADDTGATDTSGAIWSAITAAPNGSVVSLPAGRFKLSNRLGLSYANKQNITLRGAGVDVTTIVMSGAEIQGMIWSSDSGYIESHSQTVSGTKTAGTSVLTVPSTASFTEGQIAFVRYENEVDTARIIAGAPPVWTSLGHPDARIQTVRIRAKTSTTLTIDPPLTGDATNLGLRVVYYEYPNTKLLGWAFENFTVELDPAAAPAQAFNIAAMQFGWFYNIKFSNFARDDTNGSCIKFAGSYRSEIRKCEFVALTGANADGLIETGGNSSTLIEDNIFSMAPTLQYSIYDSGNTNNSVIAYNFSTGNIAGFHNAHPARNLVEGNRGYEIWSDSYHGSSSDNVYYSNFCYGGGSGGSGWWSMLIGAFKRRYVVARNFLGEDGVNSGRIAWGFKNYNLNSIGFAGPTGLSTKVGQPDYSQPGYGVNEYIIQPSDVFEGDFWADWEITATLTTRISNTSGVFTVSGGRWVTGADIYPRVWWNNKANSMGGIGASSVDAVSGNLVTMSFNSGSLPLEGTEVQVYTGPLGYQEKDLDSERSATVVHNYVGNAAGTGTLTNSSGDTFQPSLFRTAKPAWFGTKPWPVFNVDDASTADAERLPAGHRYINGNEDFLGGTSTPQFSPAPGTFGSAQNVTITSATSGATIHYTTNGSTPTTGSAVYSGAITISATTTLKAIAVKSGLSDSSVQSGTYTIVSVPTAPSSLSATAVSTSQINLTWADNSSNETSFKIEQKVGAGGAWNEIYTAAANATSYSVTGLSPGTQYYFRVYATNAGGNSSNSNEANATTNSSGTVRRRRSARFPRKSVQVVE